MSGIRVEESLQIDAEPARVWELVRDPQQVVSCIPGAEVVGERSDGSLDGRIKVKLGPTAVGFSGVVEPEFDDATRTGRLVARGVDKGGRARAKAEIAFSVIAGDVGGARFDVAGDIELDGPLASFLATGGQRLTKQMLAEFANAVSERCRGEAMSGDAEAPEEPAAPAATPVSGLRVMGALTAGLGSAVADVVSRPFRRSDR